MGSIDDLFERYQKKKLNDSAESIIKPRYENAEYTCGQIIYTAQIDTNSFLPAEYRTVTMSYSKPLAAIKADTRALDNYYKNFNDLPF